MNNGQAAQCNRRRAAFPFPSQIMGDINDIPGVMLRNKEHAVTTTLRRIIPGDYRALRDIRNPELEAAGFDFELARVYNTPLKSNVLSLLMAENLSERTEPVSGIIKSKGEWTFIPDGESGGASGLWLFSAMDYPDRFVRQIMPHMQKGGAVVLRPLRDVWLVGLQAIVLKSIVKHANRRDY